MMCMQEEASVTLIQTLFIVIQGWSTCFGPNLPSKACLAPSMHSIQIYSVGALSPLSGVGPTWAWMFLIMRRVDENVISWIRINRKNLII